jgi:hypothetical protein
MTPEAMAALYKQADQSRVDAMRAQRQQQTHLWTHVNYPKAVWELRRRKMRLLWDGSVQND